MKDRPKIKTLCHIQQDCGGCEAFNEAFRQTEEDCEYHDPKCKAECMNANNPVPHCCAANCPVFDRDNILKEKKT